MIRLIAGLARWGRAGLCALTAAAGIGGCDVSGHSSREPPVDVQPALRVVVAQPVMRDWDTRVAVSGSVEPWQTLNIDAEIGGARLDTVEVEIGTRVRRGQVLARIDARDLRDRLIQQQADVAEASANLTQARETLQGSRQLADSGATSSQQLLQARTQTTVSAARLDMAKARLELARRELQRATVTAPEAGVILASTAVVGSITTLGMQLFRLIRDGRLQWEAQVGADVLADIDTGQTVELQRPDGVIVHCKVRRVAPFVDSTTLTGAVYIDIPANSGVRAGSIVQGAILTGRTRGMAVPQSAVFARDGYQYVMKIAADSHVHPVKIILGASRSGEVQILAGLASGDRIVSAGAAFLSDGDLVRW